MILGTKNQRDTEALSKISSFAYETEESLRNGMTNFLSPFPREEVNVDQDFNRYQKGMTDIRRKMGDIVRMYNSELKDIESIVKSAHSAKDKTEAKKLKTTIMQSMLAAYKEMSGLDTTLKKEREATNKLNRMVQGVSEGSIAATGNSLNADDVMSAFRQSYNPHMMQPQASTHVSQPINNFNLSVNTPQGTSTTSYTMNQEENTVTIPDSTKEPVKINDVPVIEASQELPPIVRPEYNTTSNNSIIKNAMGIDVVIHDDINDYVPIKDGNPMMIPDYDKAIVNIKNKHNENIKEYFKYNKNDEMGWLVLIDENTLQEVDGSVLPLETIYPFRKPDLTNKLVQTRLDIIYPIMITDETPPQYVIDFYDNVKNQPDTSFEEETPDIEGF